ncbi:unnamed protein product [Rotaria socialis]|uniref:F-box domain-containing protein n=1 Tax=Rotaria socialis TaxID=392032 RepID=A0A817RSG1_9BILA|nr:unnamed protein product [Rotaria socialis]CAF3459922.1 unnamed protein product [Rotaria socialis]CAF4922042.1 unnamed protein product [Rotaria socialis]
MPNKKTSVSCIENLPNEVFHEIFDYHGGYDMYAAFSNLNNRFKDLLISSSLLLNIQFSSETQSFNEYRYQKFIILNKDYIVSFHSYNESIFCKFLKIYTIDSSFTHLRSLVLKEISTFKLATLLLYLKPLCCLFSLTICLDQCFDDLGDIYPIIFRLPFLKYVK